MLEPKTPSPELIYRYGGYLVALEDDHINWSEDRTKIAFDDLQDRILNALEEVNRSHDDAVDIEFRVILTDYVYEHCIEAIEGRQAIYSQCENAIIRYLNEPTTFQAFNNKEHGTRVIAWLCVAYADRSPEHRRGALNQVLQKLVGRTLPNTKRMDCQSAVETLYGKACWTLYEPSSTETPEGNIWAAGLLPNIKSKSKLNVELPDNMVYPHDHMIQ